MKNIKTEERFVMYGISFKTINLFSKTRKKMVFIYFPQKLFIQFSECNPKCLSEKKGGGFNLKNIYTPDCIYVIQIQSLLKLPVYSEGAG